MTDSKRSEEEVHVLDSQIIRIDRAKRRGGSHQSILQMRRDTSNCHENLKYLIEPVEKNEYNKKKIHRKGGEKIIYLLIMYGS